MSLESLPSIADTIREYGLAQRKSLGQHFLLDARLMDKIAGLAGDLSTFQLVEIGPGPGGLTRAMLARGAQHVTVIEMDERCIPALEAIAAVSNGRLTIIQGDALKHNLTQLCAKPRKIIANLPYNVGTALLVQWLEAVAAQGKDAFESMTLMFQKEVAERVTAKPGSKDYGRLAVLSQWLCDVGHGFDLPPGAFSPPPKVTSSVIQLRPLAQPRYACSLKALEAVTAAAFGQRRKMLRAALKTLVGAQAEALLEQAGINPTLRAEQVAVEGFCKLAAAFEALKARQ